jgi:TonB family protein
MATPSRTRAIAVACLSIVWAQDATAAKVPTIDHEDAEQRALFLRAAHFVRYSGYDKLARRYYVVALDAWADPSQSDDLASACKGLFSIDYARKKARPPETDFVDCPSSFTDLMYDRVDRPEILVFRAQPSFPARARRLRLSGRVIVGFDLDETGVVHGLRVLDSDHAVFDGPAMESIERSIYLPPIRDGKVVSVTGKMERIVFESE